MAAAIITVVTDIIASPRGEFPQMNRNSSLPVDGPIPSLLETHHLDLFQMDPSGSNSRGNRAAFLQD